MHAMPTDDGPLPQTGVIQRSVLVNRARRFVYLQVPKAACTTVVVHLWSLLHRDGAVADPPAASRAHDAHLPIWDDDVSLALDPGFLRFTVVRNPFARALSAYLDKMRRPADPNRLRFAKLTGMADDAEIGFRSFLELLHERPDILQSDRHWMPQNEASLFDFLKIDVAARFESLDRDLSDVSVRIFGADAAGAPAGQRAHATRASLRIEEFYSSVETDLVARIYARDFDVFGYDRDPMSEAATAPAKLTSSGSRAETPSFRDRLGETTRMIRRRAARKAAKPTPSVVKAP